MSDQQANKSKNTTRPPIVTVMGHVDHGKTSILDAIRQTNVTAGEHGGITQHIGAYQITHNDSKITFIDTPGHAAFNQMRARGGKVADIVVLVVAADSGVQPQTKEAIAHAKAGGATIIVAINKMDLPHADPQKVKQELAQENVLVEDWGGDVISVEVSAISKKGLPELLDAILATAEIQELKADPDGELEGMVIEAKLDKKRGSSVTAIIRNGTLNVGDVVYASGLEAKVKALTDDKGNQIKSAEPSKPAEILGFKDVPEVGDLILEKGSELIELAEDEERIEIVGKETKKTVSLILRADTQGTLEAIKASLANLVTENVAADYSIKFISSTAGTITDSDIMLAQSTGSYIVGFNIKVAGSAKKLSEDLSVTVKTYNTIYELVDDVKEMLEGTATTEEAKIKGRAEIIKTFKLPSGDVIAGCNVMAGAIKLGSSVKIFEKNPADLTELDEPVYVGKVKKLKQGKDDVKVVGKNNECGLLFKPTFETVAKGQFIEVIR